MGTDFLLTQFDFQSNSIFKTEVYFFLALLSLCVGSFLNVLVYRLPKGIEENKIFFHLSSPRSHCLHCKKFLKFYHLIPLISFLCLKKCCAFCKASISSRYFWVELITMLSSLLLLFIFGLTGLFLALLLFTWCLIPLVMVDLEHQILPDILTLGLLWLGLFLNIFSIITSLDSAVIGAIGGYLSLYLFVNTYEFFTKKEAMGRGDFKLFSALGAFFGWDYLPMILLCASFGGILIGGTYLFFTRKKSSTPIAFGPFLGIGAFFVFIGHYLIYT